MLKFNFKFFLITLLLLAIEVLIATVFKNWYIIRAFVGDILVVILLYTLILSFFEVKNKSLLITGIFLFSVVVEFAQLFHVADRLGFAKGSIPHLMIGNSFSWWDIGCYALGCIIVFIFQKNRNGLRHK